MVVLVEPGQEDLGVGQTLLIGAILLVQKQVLQEEEALFDEDETLVELS